MVIKMNLEDMYKLNIKFNNRYRLKNTIKKIKNNSEYSNYEKIKRISRLKKTTKLHNWYKLFSYFIKDKKIITDTDLIFTAYRYITKYTDIKITTVINKFNEIESSLKTKWIKEKSFWVNIQNDEFYLIRSLWK